MKIFNLIYDNHIEGEASAIPCASEEVALNQAQKWFELEPEEIEEFRKEKSLTLSDGTLFIEEEELRT